MAGETASPNLKTPGPVIDILVPEVAWVGALPNLKAMVKEAVERVLEEKGVFKYAPGAGAEALEVSFCFAGDAFVQKLNNEYRGLDQPTNVLSFPSGFSQTGEGKIHIGDVVLSYGVVCREAKGQKKSLADHILHLVIHGLLHLLGFDHDNAKDALEMEALEKTLLKMFGIKDPYA